MSASWPVSGSRSGKAAKISPLVMNPRSLNRASGSSRPSGEGASPIGVEAGGFAGACCAFVLSGSPKISLLLRPVDEPAYQLPRRLLRVIPFSGFAIVRDDVEQRLHIA